LSEPSSLTIIIPTRNRPSQCAALVHFLRRQGVAHRIVIADSSEAASAAVLGAACGDVGEIISFAPDIGPADKYTAAVSLAETPFVALLPDDDITFPHAIDRCLEHLANRPEATAAQGYVLDFEVRQEIFDILRVRWFTPSIDQPDSLSRLYHLLRRYQPFLWAVFRADKLLVALRQCRTAGIVCFQEMTLMTTSVILGTFTRVPCIHMLRGVEESLTSRAQSHPFFALLQDSEGFFTHYRCYRDNLAAFFWDNSSSSFCSAEQLSHVLNLIHAIQFRPELDGGALEHTVQKLLNGESAEIPMPPASIETRPRRWRDAAVRSAHPRRQYVWRQEVLHPEPQEEIIITAEERARVVRALEDYEFDVSR
jgi:glycosyltransferase domain-containing protein